LFVSLVSLLAASVLPGSPRTATGAVNSTPLQEQPASGNILSKGRLVPELWLSLSFHTNSKIAEILVSEGDSISAGAKLARLDSKHEFEARVAAAELELLLAQQALDDLNRRSGVELALTDQRLAEARKTQDTAYWKVKSLKAPVPRLDIQQVHANLLLLEKALENARKDLRRAEKLWKDSQNPIWWYAPRHAFKLNLVQMQGRIAQLEGKYNDDLDRYNDLQKPVDQIDLQQAEASLEVANSRVERAARDRRTLQNGPDPGDLALAQARIRSAEEALRASQAAFAETELHAPFAGQVITIPAKAGEWTLPGQPVMIIADQSVWNVEIQDLEETEVLTLQEGQPVQVTLDALPGEELSGRIASISLINGEKDGDVTYTVKIVLQEDDPHFRWGMTARIISFDPP
jgi:multidrug resistance efflux pump